MAPNPMTPRGPPPTGIAAPSSEVWTEPPSRSMSVQEGTFIVNLAKKVWTVHQHAFLCIVSMFATDHAAPCRSIRHYELNLI